MTSFACAEGNQDSGTSLVCRTCIPELTEHKRWKYLTVWHRIICAGSRCEDCDHSAPFESGELAGDHIETRGSCPDLVFDLTNGRCRCSPCHNKRHTGEHAIVPDMKKPNSRPALPKAKSDRVPNCKKLGCRVAGYLNGYCVRHTK